MTGAPLTRLIVAATALASAWGLGTLVLRPGWGSDLTIVLLIVAATGIAAESLLGRRARVVALQGVVALLTLGWLFSGPTGGRSTLALGLVPTPATLSHWVGLLADAFRNIRANDAPIPSSAGVTFLVVAGVAAVAVVADATAVTIEAPAVAGLPLAVPYLVAVANSDGDLPLRYGAAPVALWLLLLAVEDSSTVSRWLAASGRRLGQPGWLHQRFGWRRWPAAAAMGLVASLLAISTAGILPHLPVRYLADGLGRGSGSGTVGFSEDLDLLEDLRNPTDAPVLEYRTDDPQPPPLRVSVATRYADGRWHPRPVRAAPSSTPRLPPLPDPIDGVPFAQYTTTVDSTNLSAPHLAVPYPLAGGTVTDAHWGVDGWSGVAVTDRVPRAYTLPYLALSPTPAALRTSTDAALQRSPGIRDTLFISSDDDEAAKRYLPEVWSAAGISPTSATPYDKAVAMQGWLRSDRFTYTLDLVPPSAGTSRREAERTALDHFLTTRRGYCVQFATAMTLMARAEGIPARIVSGFLPGRPAGDVWTVRVADAHAWPELYFGDIGWVRFEPTPAARTGQAPGYTGETQATPGPTDSASAPGSTSEPSATRIDPRDRAEDDGLAPEAEEQSSSGPVLAVVLVILLLGAALVAVPLAARTVRRRSLAHVEPRERVEAQWSDLLDDLADLGIATPPAQTLKVQGDHLARSADLDSTSVRTLTKVTTAVEAARYAPDPAPVDLTSDIAGIRREAARSVSSRRRLTATLWPRLGRRRLRSMILWWRRDR